jgi:signal transduction histidine kinase
MLIEDNPGDAELVRIALRGTGGQFELHWEQRLSDGMQWLSDQRVDLALVDLSLPDSCGLEVVSRIRSEHPDLPLIVLTSLANDQLAIDALDRGAQDYLVKGHATSDILARTIRYAIQRQQNVSENRRLLIEVQEHQILLEAKNRRLEKLYRMAHRFVDNVSHEFRTPLTVIKEFVSLIREGVVGPVNTEQQRFLTTVEDRADDLNNMVDDMLDVSKMEAGLLCVRRENCQIAEIVDRVRPALERKASVRGVSLQFDIAADLPVVFCDPEKAGRVLTNLVVNAIKFCGEPGLVTVRAQRSRSGRQVVMSVIDNGAGIDRKLLQVIFRRFKQGQPNSRGSTKGFGLGLSIAKELVDVNLGAIKVWTRVGRGTKFAFTLPCACPIEVARRHLKRLQRMPGGAPALTMLVAGVEATTDVDTQEDVQAFLDYLLRRNDLLVRLDGTHWLILLATGVQELPRFLLRAGKCLDDMQRNRLRGPLPHVAFERRAAWTAGWRTPAVVRRVQQLCPAEEPIHV